MTFFVYPSHAPAGGSNLLAAVFYEPGSQWDLHVRAAQAAGEDVYLDEEPAMTLVTPTSALSDTGGTARTLRNASLIATS